MMGKPSARQLVVAHAALASVVVIGAVVSAVALRSLHDRRAQERVIDHTLVALDGLRADTRELARSARRYVIARDTKEQSRIQAIDNEINAFRASLHTSACAPFDAVDVHLDELAAAVAGSFNLTEQDPVARLARFESSLDVLHGPLTSSIDLLVARERAQKASVHAGFLAAFAAEWAALFTAVTAIALAISAVLHLARWLRHRRRPMSFGSFAT